MGFGFNSMINSPQINELTQFPFINDDGASGAGNNPMLLLASLCETDPKTNHAPWVQPKLDSYWFAAGLRVSAFDLLVSFCS